MRLLPLLLMLIVPALAMAQSDFAAAIEKSHGGQNLPGDKLLKAHLTVAFGGKTSIDGTLWTTTDAGRSRLELKDGTIAVFDGKSAWVKGTLPRARFHLLTWPYFLMAPLKLDDGGTRITPMPAKMLDGKEMAAAKLTFDAGTGDTPDDWYILYRDDQDRLAAMAYIVTYGKDAAQAEKEPHAIAYHDFKTIDGVTLPMHWTFHDWSEADGVAKPTIGEATLKDAAFVPMDASLFDKPQDATESPMP